MAGLALEWELTANRTKDLLQSYTRQGVCVTQEVLSFYLIAYAAFRMGLCNFCGSQARDLDEKARLAAAGKAYCHRLLHILNAE